MPKRISDEYNYYRAETKYSYSTKGIYKNNEQILIISSLKNSI